MTCCDWRLYSSNLIWGMALFFMVCGLLFPSMVPSWMWNEESEDFDMVSTTARQAMLHETKFSIYYIATLMAISHYYPEKRQFCCQINGASWCFDSLEAIREHLLYGLTKDRLIQSLSTSVPSAIFFLCLGYLYTYSDKSASKKDRGHQNIPSESPSD